MKTDRVVIEAKRAYRASTQFEYDRLMAEQTRWLRKRTIAENKLADVRRRIDDLAKRLAAPKAEQ